MRRIVEVETVDVWYSTIYRIESSINKWNKKHNRNIKVQSFLRPKSKFNIEVEI